MGDVLGDYRPSASRAWQDSLFLLDLGGYRMRPHLPLTQVPTKQTRQGFCVAVGANLSLLISSRKKPGKMAIKLGLGPKFSVMKKSSVPCLGSDPRQAEGAQLPAAWQRNQPLLGKLTLLGTTGSKTNRDGKNNIQPFSGLICAEVYFHSCESAIAAMVTNLEINYIKTLTRCLNRNIQPTVLAKRSMLSLDCAPPTFP